MATLLTDDVFALATLLWGLLWSRGHAVGMPWLLQRATGAAMATFLLEGLFSQLKVFSKRRFCYQRVGQCWPWQRAHGVAFVLAYGGFLGFDCVPKPWLPCVWLQP